MTKVITYIEIDVPYCSLTYGVAPCTATIDGSPQTGTIKCFNTKATCQDTANYDPETVTLRFAVPTEYLPAHIDALPFLRDVQFTPPTISLGENLGTRASLTATFTDHPHSDTGEGFDKYLADRDYDPYSQGSFWGKFRARHPYVRGQALRWYRGTDTDDSPGDMEERHFIIDSFDGPRPDGTYTITAKDVLKLADGDRALAPALSNGFLNADINDSTTSATLSPSGIGNEEYPASGLGHIGGKEIVSFTRSADALTITRAQKNTVAASHKAQDRFQLILSYSAEDPADIIRDLLVTYASVPTGYIDLTTWQAETAAYLNRVYTADICEPTSVVQLVSELIEQACLQVWWDDVNRRIGLQVIRGVLTDVDRFTPANTLEGSLQVKEQPEKRLSQVIVYFGQINPLRPLSDLDNFRSSSRSVDEDAETDYGSAAIKIVKARWIPQLGRTTADRLGAILLGRFKDPPRKINWAVMRNTEQDVALASGYRIEAQSIQDATGAASEIPVQVTRVKPEDDRLSAEAEEMLFTAPAEDLSNRQVTIDANNSNLNFRTAHDTIYPTPESGDEVTFTINTGVTIGSTSVSTFAVMLGDWPAGVTINVVNKGRIQGKGGNGSVGDIVLYAGQNGGGALYSRVVFNLNNTDGEIFGGGGGGANAYGNAGGGGAGSDPGTGGLNLSGIGTSGQDGTADAGGAAGSGYPPFIYVGGDGGDPGLPGGAGSSGGTGGTAGAAIDGDSYATITGTGDIRGPQVN